MPRRCASRQTIKSSVFNSKSEHPSNEHLASKIVHGLVGRERIFREAATAKQAQAKLEQEFSRREKELVETGNSLKLASEKFEREAPTLAESQRTTRQKQLIEQDREFQRKRREFQEDLNAQASG